MVNPINTLSGCRPERYFCVVVAAAMAFTTINAIASGFQLSEQSVTGLGRAYAGSGVAANDASVLFYNPAGMEFVDGQRFQGAINGVLLDVEFVNDSNSTGLGTGGKGDTNTAVPNFYYISNAFDNFKWGIGVSVPFGLKTTYDSDWIGRYHAIDSEFTTINVGPALSYRINDQLSIGAGIDVQYANALLSRASPPVFSPLADDSFIEVEGDSWGYGYNAGLIYQPVRELRIGLSYRSKVKHTIEGEADVSNSDIGLNGRYDAKTDITLPETAYLSASYRLSNQWELLAGTRWTRWSRFDELIINIEGLPDEIVPERWENSWMYSVGANFYPNEDIALRAGIALDRSPVPNASLRNPRTPDSDRDWFTLGISFYQLPRTVIDFGIAYLHTETSEIDNTVALSSAVRPADRLSGNFDSDVIVIGSQIQFIF